MPPTLASGAETVEIRYAFSDRDAAGESATLELFSRDDPRPIWTREVPADHIADLGGELPWDGAIDVTNEVFPDGYATLEGSPYRLKITGRGAGQESTRECPVEVVIHDVTFAVAPLECLVHERDREVCAQIERLPGKWALKLEGNVFAQNAQVHELFSWTDFGYEHYRAKWDDGAGPRIPILANILLRDGRGHGVRAPKAFGRTRLMWDYSEWRSSPSSLHPADAAFIADVTRQEVGSCRPKGGSNAPSRIGGKRGSRPAEKPVLAAADGGISGLSIAASRGTRRDWAVFTPIDRSDERAGQSAIVFRPAITAGDGYSLTAFLDVVGTLDSEDAPPSQAPSWPVGDFQIWRRVTLARRVLKCPQVDAHIGDPSSYFSPAFVEIENRIHRAVRVLGKAEYDDLFWRARAVVMSRYHERLIGAYALPEGVSQYDEGLREPGEYFGNIRDPVRKIGLPTPWVATFKTFGEWSDTVRIREGWTSQRTVEELVKVKLDTAERYNVATLTFATCIAAAMAALLATERGLTILHFGSTQATGKQMGGVAGLKEPSPKDRDKSGFALFTERSDTVAHEMGHCLYLPHAPTPASQSQPAGVVDPLHRPGSFDCLMSYNFNSRRFCAVCVLRLSGYRGDSLPPPPPPPPPSPPPPILD